MKDKEQAELLKESGEAMRNLDEEEKAKDEVVKYFDRIHDKLFAYQLFFSGRIYFTNCDTIN